MAADSDSGNESGGSSDSGPEEVHRRTAAISSAGDARWRRRMHLMEMAGASDASEDLSGGDGASGGSAGSVSGSEVSEDGMSDDGASPSDEDDGVEDVPFEVLAAQQAGAVAAGPNGAAAGPFGGALTGKRRSGSKGGGGGKDRPHRENKNRPAQASSRRPVGRLRDVVQGPRIERKDPRFEDLSGRYDPGRFRKQYAFLYDEALPQERAAVKAKLKKVKGVGAKDALAVQARQLDATLREDALRQKKGRFEAELKAKERAAVRAGKKPFFLKKVDKRKAELVAQYRELQKAGQLDKYLAKRRRKNAAKDHRYVPSARAS